MPRSQAAPDDTPGTELRNEAYGQLLRTRRESVGLTQAELARLIGVNRATIGNAEVGKSIANKTHYRILCGLGCDPDTDGWSDFDKPRVSPILSARVAGLAARAVLAYPEDIHHSISADYFGLVTAL